MNNQLGESIRLCRTGKKLSQQGLGLKFASPKSASEISRWERGTNLPSAKHLSELLTILGPDLAIQIASL